MAPPIVTGISPNDGYPGTRVTIRGENLGTDLRDLIGLTICGVDCLLSADWYSPKKIIARFGAGSGKGDVIVTTRSGGKGTSMVQFKGKLNEAIGPMKESAVWIEESYLMNLTWGRKRPTSPSQLHQDNPLGLLDEGTVQKFSENDLQDIFPDGSGNLTSENFVPAWFLLENHNQANFDDLKAGLKCLQHKVKNQKEGELSFLKANVGSVMDQLDTLNVFSHSVAKDEEDLGPNNLNHLEEAVQKSMEEAVALFQDVLGRKEHADSTRSALGVLQKFKFLFNLPCTMEKNIQKGDYDIVISDYAKAKSFCSDTKVQMFKKVYEEVDKRIIAFREMLIQKLRDFPVPLSEQKRLIRFLVHLESPGDPAWECIEDQFKFIAQILNSCKEFHIKQNDQSPEKIKFGKIQFGQGISSSRKNFDQTLPDKVLFVEELTEILADTLTDVHKLGQAYIRGDLITTEDEGNPTDPKYKFLFEEQMVKSTIFYSNLIRAAILPHTLSSAMGDRASFGMWPPSPKEVVSEWVPHCVRIVRNCYCSLIHLMLCDEALDVIQQLIFDLRINCFHIIFSQATEDIENLHLRETWVLEVDDDKGGTTQLPVLYENIVIETLQLIKKTVLQSGLREKDLLANAQESAKITNQIQRLVQAFPKTLETLAFRTDSPISPSDGNIPLSQGKKLIVILSNCNYTVNHIIPRCEEHLKNNGFPYAAAISMEVVSVFRKLHEKIFDSFIEMKTSPVVRELQETMYVGEFSWSECLMPTTTSVFVKQLILNMIAVHAEVFSVSRLFIHPVMTRLVQVISKEISRQFSLVSKFSREGSLQARIDVQSLQIITNNYKSTVSHSAFNQALGQLSAVSALEDQKLIEENLNTFQHQMKYHLMCFRYTPSNQG